LYATAIAEIMRPIRAPSARNSAFPCSVETENTSQPMNKPSNVPKIRTTDARTKWRNRPTKQLLPALLHSVKGFLPFFATAAARAQFFAGGSGSSGAMYARIDRNSMSLELYLG